MEARELLIGLWNAALRGVEPRRHVSEYFAERRMPPVRGRIGIFAAGKAAPAMADGVPATLTDEMLVVAPNGAPVPKRLRRCARFASHPEPDRSSAAAAREAISFFRGFGPDDLIVALMSGGASSLLCLPRPGVTLAEKRRRVHEAMRLGWPIEKINRLRVSLSAIKGGKLAEATSARVVTLVLSDVPGADFRIVGSGPTVSRRKGRDRSRLLADNRTGLRAAAAFARANGFAARIEPRLLAGEAATAGREFAQRLCRGGEIRLAGGETTVRQVGPEGTGGRAQELALAAALELARRGCEATVLAAGSDGVDGSSQNAGAFASAGLLERARQSGIDPRAALRAHDSASFFETMGGHFRTGPTGGNVADWVFGVP